MHSQSTVLHMFPHGLGDCCQFTAVLKHLGHYHPNWIMDVVSFQGKHTAFNGLVRNSYIQAEFEKIRGQHDFAFIHNFWECYESYSDSPGTKTVRCLREVFGLTPEWKLLTYTVHVGADAAARADAYVKTLPDKPMVVLHYEGSSKMSEKNLSHETVAAVCDYLVKRGFTPVILDWENRSPLPNNRTLFCPEAQNPLWLRWGGGDVETIAALIRRAALFIGIDSGPQKIAFSTGTPTLAVWVANHPYHFADNTGSAVHLVPKNHPEFLRGDKKAGMEFFSQNYWAVAYTPETLAGMIINRAGAMLGVL